MNQDSNFCFQQLSFTTWQKYADQIMHVEANSYEPSRRETRKFLDSIVQTPRSVAILCSESETVIGFCFGAPLEFFPNVEGTKTDPEWGKGTTLYSADVTVSPQYRNRGVGFRLKQEQIRRAHTLGFKFIAGRNRVGLAASMTNVNFKLGAFQVQYLPNSYPDDLPERDCIYYHIDVQKSAMRIQENTASE